MVTHDHLSLIAAVVAVSSSQAKVEGVNYALTPSCLWR